MPCCSAERRRAAPLHDRVCAAAGGGTVLSAGGLPWSVSRSWGGMVCVTRSMQVCFLTAVSARRCPLLRLPRLDRAVIDGFRKDQGVTPSVKPLTKKQFGPWRGLSHRMPLAQLVLMPLQSPGRCSAPSPRMRWRPRCQRSRRPFVAAEKMQPAFEVCAPSRAVACYLSPNVWSDPSCAGSDGHREAGHQPEGLYRQPASARRRRGRRCPEYLQGVCGPTRREPRQASRVGLRYLD